MPLQRPSQQIVVALCMSSILPVAVGPGNFDSECRGLCDISRFLLIREEVETRSDAYIHDGAAQFHGWEFRVGERPESESRAGGSSAKVMAG